MNKIKNTGSLSGKNALIIGAANERSLAWGIAKRLSEAGCNVGFSYLNPSIEKRIRPLAETLGSTFVEKCDVSTDQEIDDFFSKAKNHFGKIDILIHSVAYAKKENLVGRYVETERGGFSLALDISTFSLVACSKAVEPLMKDGGSIITLSYLGAEKVVENYNVMGVAKAALEASVRYLANDLGKGNIRVNAISSGPVRTLAASGLKNFRETQEKADSRAPIKGGVTLDDVGNVGFFLSSDMSRMVTGSVIYVDGGVNITSGF